MANLKAGTTVGGAIVWNAGNLAFRPAEPTELLYKNKRVYTEYTPPTAAEVDAVSAKDGGTFLKNVTFNGGITFPPSGAGSISVIRPGNGDGATYATCNIDIAPWWGLGISNPTGTGIAGRTIVFDARYGKINTKGEIRSDAGGVFDAGNRVWSDSFVPTLQQMNALGRNGDTGVGAYRFTGQTSGNALTLGVAYNLRGEFLAANGSTQTMNYLGVSDQIFSIGQTHGSIASTRIQTPGAQTLEVRYGSNQIKKIFHEGFTPTADQVGLGLVTNDPQLKRNGDSVPSSDFTFRSLQLEADPTNDKHAVRLGYLNDKAFVRRGVLAVDVDWNTIRDAGSYRVNNFTGLNGPEESGYKFGLLAVMTDINGMRCTQVYYPHRVNAQMAWRVFDSGTNNWQAWSYVTGQKEADGRYLRLIGDTMTGQINLSDNKGIVADNNSKNLLAYDGINKRVIVGDVALPTYLRVNDPKKLFVTTNSNVSGTGVGAIFSQLNPPDKNDVGLDKLDNLPQLPNVRCETQSGGQLKWYKIGEVVMTTGGSSYLNFMVHASYDYGQTASPTDIVSVSGRGVSATDTLDAALVDRQLKITRINGETGLFGSNTNTSVSYFLTKGTDRLIVWMRSPNWSDGMSVTLQNQSTGTNAVWSYTGVSTSAPTGFVQSRNTSYVYTTTRPPTNEEIGLGKVTNDEQLPLNGSKSMTGGLIAPTIQSRQWIYAAGSGGFKAQTAGAWLNWEAGTTQLWTNRGNFAGGFSFIMSDTTNAAAVPLATLDTESRLNLKSVLPLATPGNLPAGDVVDKGQFDVGFQMMPQKGYRDVGYPADGGVGMVVKFKANAHRHLQLYSTGGSFSGATNDSNGRLYMRSLREDQDVSGTSPNAIKWQELITDLNMYRTVTPLFIEADSAIDLGVVT